MSRSTWATGWSSTSASRRRTRMTPNGRCAPRWRSSPLFTGWPARNRCKYASVSPPAQSSSARPVPAMPRYRAPRSAKRPISPLDCRGSPAPTRSSSPQPRIGCSATASRSKISATTVSGASTAPCERGASAASRAPKAASTLPTPVATRPSSVANRRSRCCSRAGSRRAKGKARWCCWSASPASARAASRKVLRERLAATPHTRLGYQCSPYHSGSAFYPIVEQLERAAGFERDDSPERKLDKLEAVLVLSADERPSVTPLFAALLSLPIDRYPPRMACRRGRSTALNVS